MRMADAWPPAPKSITLAPRMVHVWLLGLDVTEPQRRYLASLLSHDEKVRAGRYHYERSRFRFMVGRGMVRCILSDYLGLRPNRLKFRCLPSGKPVLDGLPETRPVHFNYAHANHIGLCAVHLHQPVGIDVVCTETVADTELIAERFFSRRERDVLLAAPRALRRDLFCRYWACKEAFLKATGAGLTQVEQIEIALRPGEPARICSAGPWTLFEFRIGKDYQAALAMAGTGYRMGFWSFDWSRLREYGSGMNNSAADNRSGQ